MRRVWSDTRRLYGSTFPVLVTQDRCVGARGSSTFSDKEADKLGKHRFLTTKKPPELPRPILRIRPMAINTKPEERVEIDFTSLSRKALVELCRERNLTVKTNMTKLDLIRLLKG
jgi:hypothetical protein